MENNSLKPCPFCGGMANHKYDPYKRASLIVCDNCGASTRYFPVAWWNDWSPIECKEFAIGAWNRRV